MVFSETALETTDGALANANTILIRLTTGHWSLERHLRDAPQLKVKTSGLLFSLTKALNDCESEVAHTQLDTCGC